MKNDVEYILCAAIWYKEIPLKKIIPGVLPKNCDRGLVVLGKFHRLPHNYRRLIGKALRESQRK